MAEKLNKDVVYRSAKHKDKDYFINDGGGLYLLVKSNGTKLWHFIFTFEGKRKRLSLGVYPDTALESARRKSEDARKQIAGGIDPAVIRDDVKKARQLGKQNQERVKGGLPILDSFADVTHKWLDSIAHLTSQTTHIKKTSRNERLAFPVLGDKPIKEIKSSDVLVALKPLIQINTFVWC